MKRDPAPVFTDSFALCEWLLSRLDQGTGTRVLSRQLCTDVLLLVESVALALKGRRVAENLEAADERLVTLRLKLRLAEATELLSQEQLLFALQATDAIGRQLGGWLRTLGPS